MTLSSTIDSVSQLTDTGRSVFLLVISFTCTNHPSYLLASLVCRSHTLHDTHICKNHSPVYIMCSSVCLSVCLSVCAMHAHNHTASYQKTRGRQTHYIQLISHTSIISHVGRQAGRYIDRSANHVTSHQSTHTAPVHRERKIRPNIHPSIHSVPVYVYCCFPRVQLRRHGLQFLGERKHRGEHVSSCCRRERQHHTMEQPGSLIDRRKGKHCTARHTYLSCQHTSSLIFPSV